MMMGSLMSTCLHMRKGHFPPSPKKKEIRDSFRPSLYLLEVVGRRDVAPLIKRDVGAVALVPNS